MVVAYHLDCRLGHGMLSWVLGWNFGTVGVRKSKPRKSRRQSGCSRALDLAKVRGWSTGRGVSRRQSSLLEGSNGNAQPVSPT